MATAALSFKTGSEPYVKSVEASWQCGDRIHVRRRQLVFTGTRVSFLARYVLRHSDRNQFDDRGIGAHIDDNN